MHELGLEKSPQLCSLKCIEFRAFAIYILSTLAFNNELHGDTINNFIQGVQLDILDDVEELRRDHATGNIDNIRPKKVAKLFLVPSDDPTIPDSVNQIHPQ